MENSSASPDSAGSSPTSGRRECASLQNGSSPGPFYGKATAQFAIFGTNGLVPWQQQKKSKWKQLHINPWRRSNLHWRVSVQYFSFCEAFSYWSPYLPQIFLQQTSRANKKRFNFLLHKKLPPPAQKWDKIVTQLCSQYLLCESKKCVCRVMLYKASLQMCTWTTTPNTFTFQSHKWQSKILKVIKWPLDF